MTYQVPAQDAPGPGRPVPAVREWPQFVVDGVRRGSFQFGRGKWQV